MSGEKDPIAALFEVPPDEFVAARDALARSLTQAGDKPAAKAVKAMRKPSATVWALNQLAHREAAALSALFDAGQAMRRAQTQAIGGQGADALRAATQSTRKQIAALVRAAESIFAESGRKAGPAITRELYEALHAVAAADDATREALRRGRLEAAPEAPSGFGEVAGVSTMPAGAPSPANVTARSHRAGEESPAHDPKAHARDEQARAAAAKARAEAEAKAEKARADALAAEKRAAELRTAELRAKAVADERLAVKARERADRLTAEATQARADALAAEHAASRSRADADAAERLSRR